MNDYINHIKETGKQEEMIAFLFAIGSKAPEIAQLFGISRQSVYNNIDSYKKKLKLQGEEVKFYGK